MQDTTDLDLRLQDQLRRLGQALAEGRCRRPHYHKARRKALIAHKKAVRTRRKDAQYAGRFRRARRNMDRWEAKTGLPATTPWMDHRCRFRYWNFERNEVQVWGWTRDKIKFRKRR